MNSDDTEMNLVEIVDKKKNKELMILSSDRSCSSFIITPNFYVDKYVTFEAIAETVACFEGKYN